MTSNGINKEREEGTFSETAGGKSEIKKMGYRSKKMVNDATRDQNAAFSVEYEAHE